MEDHLPSVPEVQRESGDGGVHKPDMELVEVVYLDVVPNKVEIPGEVLPPTELVVVVDPSLCSFVGFNFCFYLRM